MKKVFFVFALLIVCFISYGQGKGNSEMAFHVAFWAKQNYKADELKGEKGHTEYVYAIAYDYQYRSGDKPFFYLRIYDNCEQIIIENPRNSMGNWVDMAIPVRIGFLDKNGKLVEKQLRKFEIKSKESMPFRYGYSHDKAFNKKFFNYLMNTGNIRLVIEMQGSEESLDFIVPKIDKKNVVDMKGMTFVELGKAMVDDYKKQQKRRR